MGRMIALLICVIAFPLHLLICAVIRLTDGGPAMYCCIRVGKSGRLFKLFKYRSMKVNAAHFLSPALKMVVYSEDPRVTLLGRWLRCGIDELPQLWNIAKGEMAWIGPRPDPDWILAHYGPISRERLQTLPGITGFAQLLNSRYLSTSEGYALDVWYIAHRTLWLDLWIILATPLFIAGWRSLGKYRLERLRNNLEFGSLYRKCDEEFVRSKEALLMLNHCNSLLPPNTVLC